MLPAMPDYLPFLLVAGFVALLFLLARWQRSNRRRRAEQMFGPRPELSPQDFYQQFYAGSGIPQDRVEFALRMLATITRMPAGYLRPEDSLDMLRQGLSAKLETSGSAALQVVHANVNFQGVATVDEFIRAVGKFDVAGAAPNTTTTKTFGDGTLTTTKTTTTTVVTWEREDKQ